MKNSTIIGLCLLIMSIAAASATATADDAYSQPVSVQFPYFSTGNVTSQPVSAQFPYFSTGNITSQPVSVQFPYFSTGDMASQPVSVQFSYLPTGTLSSSLVSAVFGAPAGMWHMNNNWQDSSGNNLHGTAYGNAYFEPNGILNNAGGFNGTSAYVKVGTSALLRPPLYLTIMGWAKIPPGSSGSMGIAGNIDESSKTGYALIIQDGVPQVKIGNGSLVEAVSAGVIPPDGTWFHLAGTYDGTSLKIYVNGQVAGEKAVPAMILMHSNPFYIGYSSAGYFSGVMDELAVYPRALSDAEILRIVSTAVVDVIPPSVPTVDQVISPTTSQTVILSGTKDTDSSILVNNVLFVPIDNSTTWQYEKALSEGNNILNISSMDEEGNQSKAVTLTILFDSTPPSITDSWPLDNSFINKNISSVVFNLIDKYSGIDLAATVKSANVIDVSGLNVSGTWTTSGTGTVTFIPFAPFADGLYTAVIYPTDSLGNRGSGWTTFTIDTSPPPAPTIDPVLSPTRTASQTIKGTKSSDSVGVVVTGTDLSIGTIAYPLATTWNTSISGLKDGGNIISVYAVDAAGNQSQGASVSIVYDVTLPAVPTVNPFASPTKESSVTLTGTKEADSYFYVNGTKTTFSFAGTSWSYTVSLGEGNNTFTMYVKDEAGNQSQSVTAIIVRDTTAPVISSSTPTINSYTNQAGSIEIILSDSYSSIDLQESLNGAVVRDSSGATVSGQWSVVSGYLIFTPSSALTDSVYTATLYPVDSLGNKGTASFSFTYDSIDPILQSLTMSPDSPHKAETVMFTIAFNEDMLTSVQPAVSFTRGGSNPVYTLSGSWTNSKTWSGSYTFTSTTGDGVYSIKVSGAKDKAQNLMAANEAYTFVLDAAAPGLPTVSAVSTPTRNSTVTLTGTKDTEAYLYINNTKISASGYSDGLWSYTAGLNEGNNAFTISLKDEAGNQSPSASVSVVRDTTPPAISSSTPANNAYTMRAGTIEVALSDTYSSADLQASLEGDVVKNSGGTAISGQWSVAGGRLVFTPSTPLTDSTYTVTLYPVDSLGNKGTATLNFTVDSTPPAVQSLTMSPDTPHKAEQVTFNITFNEDMSTASQPTVTFSRGYFYSTYAVSGNWVNSKTWSGTYQFTANNGDGTYTMKVSDAKDRAGNTMTATENATFVLDTSPPQAPTVSAGTTPTKTTTVTLSGTKPADTAVVINGPQRVALGSSTTWSYTYNLAEGQNNLSITARDAAGNDSTAVTTSITLDTTPPSFTVNYVNPSPTQTQTITGTKEAGCIVKLNSGIIFDSADRNTSWSYAVSLTEGLSNHLVFTASDSIGNTTTKTIDILYDLSSPSPLAEGMLVADGGGKGTEVTLTWPSYAESSDLAYYRVYYSTSNFTTVGGLSQNYGPEAVDSGLSPKLSGTANKGTKTFKVSGLTQGTTYYFAVVPVDAGGNSDPQVYTASAAPTDTAAPEEVTSLTAQAGFNSLNGNYIKLNWTAGANSIGDMADQIIYFDGGTGYDSGTSVGKSATSYLKSSLKDALKYKFKITTKDAAGHESTGVVVEAVTRLSNPTGLTAAPGNQKMILTWSAVSSPYVKQYNIYRAQSSAQQYFADEMTLIKSLTSTSFTDTNLTNGAVYQYAVTVVNTYGAEKRDDLYSISATPRGDTTGPLISGLNITQNQVVSAPITITASAQDAESSMGKMEVYIDGSLVGQASCLSQAGSPCPITYSWNVVSTTDGNHSVKIAAYDSLGNASEVSVPVVVSLAPPATPSITGHNVIQASPEYLVKVSGSAPISTTVTLKVNGVVVSQLPTPDSGLFTFDSLKLTEGDNIISAKTSHRGGDSAWSPDYKVTVDTGAPNAPVSLTAKALAGGTLQFTWQAGAGEVPTGYNLYVSSSAFTSKADAGVTKANTSPIAYMFREYIPADDNKKYYAATALDSAGNESAISNVISISADRTSPSLASIGYTYTDISGTVKEGATLAGPGTVKAAITVSEPLSELPFLSLEPVDGSPIVVSLKKSSTTPAPPYQGGEIYEGTFTVNAQTPYGTTTYKFSGKDIVGNRGSSQGTGLTIDSRGPIASVTSPVTLLQITDSPVEVKVSFDEAPVSTPVLEVKDSKGVSAAVEGTVPDLPATQGAVESGLSPALKWKGTVNISALSEGNAEFILKDAKDSLGNISTKVASGKSILLYKDSVPAPSVPTGLTAKTAKEGKISLRWDNVSVQWSGASGQVTYNIYRRAEGETTSVQAATSLTTNTFSDIPPVDGKYYYSVTSLGLLNSESARSDEVGAVSDSTGPPTPTGLLLSLDGNGVKAIWDSPLSELPTPNSELLYYRLYRSDGGITTISGLTPVATVNTTTASDPSPTSSKRFYAVTSMDSLGNESAPSETQEIVFPVAPVRNLVLSRVDTGKPAISWQAPEGSIQGYHIYRNGNRITETPTLSTAYSDGYYSGGSITYGISAVDDLGSESPVREATLPDMTIGLKEWTTLRRGALETVSIVANAPSLPLFTKEGDGGSSIDSVALKIGSLPESTLDGPFTLTTTTPAPPYQGGEQGEAASVEVKKVASTEANAPSEVAVVTTAIMNPSPGTTVKITKTSTANVLGSGTALEIFNEPLVRGTTGKVRIKVNNLGSARTEFLTSQNNGPTSQVKVNLRDQDGNLLATGNLDQRTGEVVSSGSYATARIEAGSSFLSDPITFNVPTSAPYKVLIEAIIDNTYYHYNQTDQVTAPGLKQSVESAIVETAYRATASPEKTIYKQGETVKITGSAISNTPSPLAGEGGGEGVPNVPVKIGISVKGFDRYYTVSSDENGNFAYTFTPGSNEAGAYTVWASHPDITDRGNQGQFSIVGLQLEPTVANIKMGKGQSFDIPVTLKNLGDTTLADISYAITASGGITAGIINSGDNTLTANESQGIAVRITADSSAPDTGTAAVQWTVASGEDTLTVKLDANITLVKPIPIISTSPSYIDTGLVRGSQKIYTFDIKNTGLDTLKNARLEGPSTSWLSLTVDKNIGDIGVNQSKSVGIAVKPGEDVQQGVYNDKIVIYSDNHIPYIYNIQITVTSNAIGNILFDVLNVLMEDVPNATITIQHQKLLELLYTVKTGTDGTAMLYDIPEGRYTYNISASNHIPTSGTFDIVPGVTTPVYIALDMKLVDISWSVEPMVIEDRYEIKISQTFETNVPVPVLITEPAVTNLPEMQPGQVFNGEFTVKNYGLIAADNVKINFPTSFLDYDIEVLTSSISDKIPAMGSITVPYRITRRLTVGWAVPTDTSSAYACNSELFDEVQGYGGGSCVTSFNMSASGDYTKCPNTPQQSQGTASASHTISVPQPCTTNTSGAGGGYVYTGGSTTGSQGVGGSMPGVSPAQITTNNPCDCKAEGASCPDDGKICTLDLCLQGSCLHIPVPNGGSGGGGGGGGGTGGGGTLTSDEEGTSSSGGSGSGSGSAGGGGTCCFNGESVPNSPIEDLSQCPNRTSRPWTTDYDGCTRVFNNPAAGEYTTFSNTQHTGACDAHDECYQTCWSGDLGAARAACDQKFRDIAYDTCSHFTMEQPEATLVCFAAAETYYLGIKAVGWLFFDERQKEVCNCCK